MSANHCQVLWWPVSSCDTVGCGQKDPSLLGSCPISSLQDCIGGFLVVKTPPLGEKKHFSTKHVI